MQASGNHGPLRFAIAAERARILVALHMAMASAPGMVLADIRSAPVPRNLLKLLFCRAVELSLGGVALVSDQRPLMVHGHGLMALMRDKLGDAATMGSGIEWLRSRGAPALANRVRLAARGRHVAAHPGKCLGANLAALLEPDSEREVGEGVFATTPLTLMGGIHVGILEPRFAGDVHHATGIA